MTEVTEADVRALLKRAESEPSTFLSGATHVVQAICRGWLVLQALQSDPGSLLRAAESLIQSCESFAPGKSITFPMGAWQAFLRATERQRERLHLEPEPAAGLLPSEVRELLAAATKGEWSADQMSMYVFALQPRGSQMVADNMVDGEPAGTVVRVRGHGAVVSGRMTQRERDANLKLCALVKWLAEDWLRLRGAL